MKTKQINQKVVIDLNEKQLDLITSMLYMDWPENAPLIKDTLLKLSNAYIRSEEIEADSQEERKEVSWHLELLMMNLNDLKEIALASDETDHSDTVLNSRCQGTIEHECQECLKKDGIIELLEEQLKAKEVRINELCIELGRKKNCKTLSISK